MLAGVLGEECFYECELLFSSAVCEESVVADVHEPFRQDMEQEPAYELDSVQAHCFLAIAVGVVSPEKAHSPVFDGE